jgi:hypothetical protein
LFACGGGGGGSASSTPPVSSPPPPVAESPLVVTSANADAAAQLGFGYGGIALGFGQLAADWTAAVDKSPTLSFSNACSRGGTITATLADRDGDHHPGAGDQLTVSLSGCYLKELDDTFDGTVVIALSAPLASQQRAGVMSFTGFHVINSTPTVTVTGALRFDYSASRLSKVVHVSSDTQSFGMTVSDATHSVSDTVTALDARHETRLDTVRATTSMQYHVASGLLGGSLDVSTPTPWGAWFDTYPDAGETRATGAGGTRASLRAGTGDTFDVLAADTVIAHDSADGTGVLWTGAPWLPQDASAAQYTIQPASASGFRALIQPDPATAPLLPNGPLVWVLSRPLDPLLVPSATFFQTSSAQAGPFTAVPAKVSIEGAMLTVTPATQLQLGAGYDLQFSTQLRDTNGGFFAPYIYSAKVAQTVNASLVTSAAPLLLGSGTTLALDASASSANGAAVASTRWRQLSGPPLTLSDTSAPRITISSAGNANGIAVIELEAANAAGDIDRKQVSVTVAPDLSGAFVIAYRTGSAPLAVFSNIDAAASGYVANQQANTVLDVLLSDPQALRFLVGLTGGQTWQAGLNLTYGPGNTSGVIGAGWLGCGAGASTGSFSILEYALDGAGNVARLALDFDDTCGAPGVVTQGSIRYHSGVPVRR